MQHSYNAFKYEAFKLNGRFDKLACTHSRMNCMLKMDSIKEHTVIQAKAEGCLFCLSRLMACSLVCKTTGSLFKYEYGIE